MLATWSQSSLPSTRKPVSPKLIMSVYQQLFNYLIIRFNVLCTSCIRLKDKCLRWAVTKDRLEKASNAFQRDKLVVSLVDRHRPDAVAIFHRRWRLVEMAPYCVNCNEDMSWSLLDVMLLRFLRVECRIPAASGSHPLRHLRELRRTRCIDPADLAELAIDPAWSVIPGEVIE